MKGTVETVPLKGVTQISKKCGVRNRSVSGKPSEEF